ncbi:MAG: colanic acid biosynthesis glycosyltransferase WcaL [Candidatus Hydrogenedentota bacterium]|nr:MAG: colanic acid biosynthesis glycosyltransferase WcaL [Candidatus Hydrogenedentota bacterium]
MPNTPSHTKPRIAYLTTSYPSVSHTFIRREIQGLEQLGYDILRLSIRPGGEVVDPADVEEDAKTWHCLAQPKAGLTIAACATLITRPFKTIEALKLVWTMSRRSDRGLFRHLAYLAEAGVFLRILQRERIDHIHVHFGTNPAAVACLIQILGGPGYSMTIHGPDELDAPVGFSLGDKINHSRFTVAITNFCGSQLRRWVKYDQWDKIKIVHCNVGERWFDAAEPVHDDAQNLVCVGRLSGQKGQLLLVDAFADVVKQGVPGNLILVGDGEMREVIEEHIAQHGIQNRVTITGWQNEFEVRGHLLNARALVLGSFAEGLPVVIMEAMALQRPVIATTINGIPELVHDHQHGWLVIAGNMNHLANAMTEAMQAPIETLRTMGKAGQERVRTRHSTETEVQKLDALFQEYTNGS